jgi:hypothetical protein
MPRGACCCAHAAWRGIGSGHTERHAQHLRCVTQHVGECARSARAARAIQPARRGGEVARRPSRSLAPRAWRPGGAGEGELGRRALVGQKEGKVESARLRCDALTHRHVWARGRGAAVARSTARARPSAAVHTHTSWNGAAVRRSAVSGGAQAVRARGGARCRLLADACACGRTRHEHIWSPRAARWRCSWRCCWRPRLAQRACCWTQPWRALRLRPPREWPRALLHTASPWTEARAAPATRAAPRRRRTAAPRRRQTRPATSR